MLTYSIATAFAFAGIVSVFVIVMALRSALPRVAQLRRDLASVSDRLAVTARIFETVVSSDDGKIVRLPVRVRMVPQPALRDAA